MMCSFLALKQIYFTLTNQAPVLRWNFKSYLRNFYQIYTIMGRLKNAFIHLHSMKNKEKQFVSI